MVSAGLLRKVLLNSVFLGIQSFEGFDAAWGMAKTVVQVSDKEHAGEENIRVEFQDVSSVDSKFFQIKEFF